jgi:hypothetical protein
MPYASDGDEGDGCNTDLQERLRRLSPLKKDKKLIFADCCIPGLYHYIMGYLMVLTRAFSERSWMLDGLHRVRVSRDMRRDERQALKHEMA